MPRRTTESARDAAEANKPVAAADGMEALETIPSSEGEQLMDYENMVNNDDVLSDAVVDNDSGEVSVEAFDESDFADEMLPSSGEASSDTKNTETDPPYNAEDVTPTPRQRRQRTPQQEQAPVLTLEVGADVETQKDKENAVWHEIKNSQVTGTHLTGILGKVEILENGGLISIVEYKGQRIAIPIKEMMLGLSRQPGQSDQEYNERTMRVLVRMMGAEIDFVVRGITTTGGGKAAVASRKAAMLRLRRRYYLQNSTNSKPQIYSGRIVEARIVAVSQLAVRVEIFGVETPIRNRDISWGYVGDCRDNYFVGDSVQVRIKDVEGDTPETLRVRADIKSLTQNNSREKLLALKTQTSSVGKVTDVNGGVVFMNLVDGVRAIAHKCFDRRKPGRGDDVLFVCTRIDEDGGVAIGIIPRIIKRNI